MHAGNVLIELAGAFDPTCRPTETLKARSETTDNCVLIYESPRTGEISNHYTHQFLRKMSRLSTGGARSLLFRNGKIDRQTDSERSQAAGGPLSKIADSERFGRTMKWSTGT